MNKKNAQLVAGLRQLCDFIEANGDFEFVTQTTEENPIVVFNWREWYLWRKPAEEKRRLFAELAKILGKSNKVYFDNFLLLRRNFGPFVRFEAVASREVVCERIVTGRKIVRESPEIIIPARPMMEIDEVEWNCKPILEILAEVEDGQA